MPMLGDDVIAMLRDPEIPTASLSEGRGKEPRQPDGPGSR